MFLFTKLLLIITVGVSPSIEDMAKHLSQVKVRTLTGSVSNNRISSAEAVVLLIYTVLWVTVLLDHPTSVEHQFRHNKFISDKLGNLNFPSMIALRQQLQTMMSF